MKADENLTSIESRNAANLWDHIGSVMEVLNDPIWTWALNTQCKYLNVRIDMRDGGCIIMDRTGKRISPNQLKWQYSKETPNPPSDDEAYRNEE